MNKDAALAELRRARKPLRSAETLCEGQLIEDAVSRAYYAIMHSAKAALLVHEAIAESHARRPP